MKIIKLNPIETNSCKVCKPMQLKETVLVLPNVSICPSKSQFTAMTSSRQDDAGQHLNWEMKDFTQIQPRIGVTWESVKVFNLINLSKLSCVMMIFFVFLFIKSRGWVGLRWEDLIQSNRPRTHFFSVNSPL